MKASTLAVGAAALALWAALASVILGMPAPAIDLGAAVQARLDASGVGHPVTAVLLNFRGYDTLLEVAVLLMAQAGMLAAGTVPPAAPLAAPPMLALMARASTPPMVLVAGYLLWAGASGPGGAFQAGAVLAASLVLLYLGGVIPAWGGPALPMRIGVAGGLMVFLAVAALPSASGALLRYPPGLAAGLIVLLESALALSIGLGLGGLFLWLPRERRVAT